MVKTLLKSVREYKKSSILCPLFMIGEAAMENKISIPVKHHEKVCASPAEQDCSYFIS